MKTNVKREMVKVAKSVYKNEPTGHDFGHIKRVLKYCKKLYKKEGGNWEIVFSSALFHDVHRVLQTKREVFVKPEDAMDEVENLLSKFKSNFTGQEYKQILYNIKNHEGKESKINKNKELKILLDADLLDSLGKIGLKRTMKYCRYHNIPFYSPEPLDSPDYVVNIHPISTSHFVFRTMIPQYDLLKTNAAKKIAGKDKNLLLKFIEKQKKRYYKINKGELHAKQSKKV